MSRTTYTVKSATTRRPTGHDLRRLSALRKLEERPRFHDIRAPSRRSHAVRGRCSRRDGATAARGAPRCAMSGTPRRPGRVHFVPVAHGSRDRVGDAGSAPAAGVGRRRGGVHWAETPLRSGSRRSARQPWGCCTLTSRSRDSPAVLMLSFVYVERAAARVCRWCGLRVAAVAWSDAPTVGTRTAG